MKLNKYNLIDTNTKKIINKNVPVTNYEVKVLNWAYAVNGVKKKYVKV